MRFYTDDDMFNRFDGSSVSENLPPGYSRSGDQIDVSTDLDISATGYYVVTEAIVNATARTTLTANGVHLSFYNCIVNIDTSSTAPMSLNGHNNFSAGQNNSGTIIAGVSGNESISKTINYYGCTIYQQQGGRRNYYTSDFHDSNFIILQGQMFNYLRNGSRVERTNASNPTGSDTNWELSSDVTNDLSLLNFELNRLADVAFFNWGQGDVSVKELDVVTNKATPVLYALGGGSKSVIPNILSESPLVKITDDGQIRYDQSSQPHVRKGRVIESMFINPIVSPDAAGIDKTQGLRLQAQLDYSFSATNYNDYTSAASTINYETDTNGRFLLSGTPTIAFGEIYPVIMTRTAQWQSGNLLSTLTDYDNVVVMRLYDEDIIVLGIQSQEYNLIVDKDSTYALLSDTTVLQTVPNTEVTLSSAAASSLSGISINKGTTTLTIGENRTMTEIFCYIRQYMHQFSNFDTPVWCNYDGSEIDLLNGWNMEINASISGVYDTSGTISLSSVPSLSNLTINSILDFTVSGSYTLDGCVINDVTSSVSAVTLNLTNGSTVTTNSSPDQITIRNPVTVRVTAIDTGTSAISGVRVYLEAGSGGDLAQGDVILNALTDVNGIAEDTDFDFTNTQPLQNSKARKSTSSPLYRSSSIVGNIGSMGLDVTVTMVSDE